MNPGPESGPDRAEGDVAPDLTGGSPADPEAQELAEPEAPPTEPQPPATEPAVPRRSAAPRVAAGIMLSRLAGLLREAVFARYFGVGFQADAFRAALRMPNVLQNLLGEGTLSASFIPVYSELLHQGRREEAGRVAGAVFALLLAVGGGLALIGSLAAPLLVTLFTTGFDAETRALAIRATRIIFPMTGILVLSAWALGILNSHRRFLLPYVAPVAWNAAMIASLVFLGSRMELTDLTVALAWGALVGGALQFLVQLPMVLRLEPDLRIRWDLRREGVRTTLRNAGPAVMGRGVVQLSGWADLFLASWMGRGAVAGIGYAQTLYLLPISLFGMSVAAADLPELARERGSGSEVLRARVNRGLRQTALFVFPTFVGYVFIGDIVVAAMYQRGQFTAAHTAYVHLLLAVYALGLLASTATRVYSSAFYALQQTRTTARVATIRVLVSALLGGTIMLLLRPYSYRALPLGAVGLAFGASVGAWVEWWQLRRKLAAQLGGIGIGARTALQLAGAAAVGAAAAFATAWLLSGQHPTLRGALALAVYGAVYFPVGALLGAPEARDLLARVAGRLRRR